MKLRTYVVSGTSREGGEYAEHTVQAISAKQAFEIAKESRPDVKFISSRKQGCSCGK